MNERLYRSTQDRVLAGVCGGIAERYDLDPSLVRVGFVVFAVITAILPLLLIYVVMAVVVPESPFGASGGLGRESGAAEPGATGGPTSETAAAAGGATGPPTTPRPRREPDRTGAIVFGGLLIVVGIAFAIRQYVEIDWAQVWPLILIGFGVILVVVSMIPRGGRSR